MTIHKCCAATWPAGARHSYPCSHSGKIERDGKWYCGIHDPVKRAEKQAERTAKWNAEWEAKKARWAAEKQQAETAAKWAAVGPRLLEALKSCEYEIMACLREESVREHADILSALQTAYDAARAAIKEATDE